MLADAVASDPGIHVLAGHSCMALRRLPSGGLELDASPVGLGLEEASSEGAAAAALVLLTPTLVVAADGAKSQVRATLDVWAQADAADALAATLQALGPASAVAQAANVPAGARAVRAHGRRFALAARPSPSAGHRYKVLSLPGGFPLDASAAPAKTAAVSDAADTAESAAADTTKPVERAVPTMTYSFRSKRQADPKRACRLGVLPRPSAADARTANLITAPDHALWTVRKSLLV